MTDVVRTTLRIGILRAAKEQYEAMRDARHITENERGLYALYVMECELWAREVLASIPDRAEGTDE